jgi:hypothetical protein
MAYRGRDRDPCTHPQTAARNTQLHPVCGATRQYCKSGRSYVPWTSSELLFGIARREMKLVRQHCGLGLVSPPAVARHQHSQRIKTFNSTHFDASFILFDAYQDIVIDAQ